MRVTPLCPLQVVKYWPNKGKSGFLVWRFLLRRDDPTPAPWTREGKKRMKELGLAIQVGAGGSWSVLADIFRNDVEISVFYIFLHRRNSGSSMCVHLIVIILRDLISFFGGE